MMCVCYNKNAKKNPWNARYRDPVLNKRISIGCFDTEEEARKAYADFIAMKAEAGVPIKCRDTRKIKVQEGYATATQIARMYGIELNIAKMLGEANVERIFYRHVFVYHVDSAKEYIEMNMPKVINREEKKKERCRREGKTIGAEPQTPAFFSLPPLDAFKKVAKEFRDNSIWQ